MNLEDFNFDLSLESYETMGKPNSDKYEFIYPNYSLTKTSFLKMLKPRKPLYSCGTIQVAEDALKQGAIEK